jgi:hypothetical protein
MIIPRWVWVVVVVLVLLVVLAYCGHFHGSVTV